jgi:hypothetical protein
MTDVGFSNFTRNKKFIKLAKKVRLEQWNDAGDILFTSFCQMIGWLTG